MLSPQDFMVKVNVSWRGSVEATDFMLKRQMAVENAQFLFQFAAPAGIMTPDNIYNTVRSVMEANPDLDSVEQFITKPQVMQQTEVEKQQNEIIRMKNGFDAMVKIDEKHDIHLAVIEQYMNDPSNQQALQDPAFAQRLKTHATIHMQAEQQLQGMGDTKGLVKQVVQRSQNGETE